MQYQNLKNHITAHIGPNKKYDAISLEKKPQKKHTFSTAAELLRTIKKGLAVYRKTKDRDKIKTNPHEPTKWKWKLDDHHVTSAAGKENNDPHTLTIFREHKCRHSDRP